MTICPIFISDPEHPGRYERALKDWLLVYERSGTSMPVLVATDTDGFHGLLGIMPGRMADIPEVFPFAIDAPHCTHPLHRVGWLRSLAIERFAPCVVVDLDLWIMGDISALEDCEAPIAAVPDAGGYGYDGVPGWTSDTVEINAGLIVANDPAVARRYRELHEQILGGTRFGLMPSIEQVIWSIVLREAGGQMLDREYNWSRTFGGRPIEHKTWHEHGPTKWRGDEAE
jgi:hypothetical protein